MSLTITFQALMMWPQISDPPKLWCCLLVNQFKLTPLAPSMSWIEPRQSKSKHQLHVWFPMFHSFDNPLTQQVGLGHLWIAKPKPNKLFLHATLLPTRMGVGKLPLAIPEAVLNSATCYVKHFVRSAPHHDPKPKLREEHMVANNDNRLQVRGSWCSNSQASWILWKVQ